MVLLSGLASGGPDGTAMLAAMLPAAILDVAMLEAAMLALVEHLELRDSELLLVLL